MIEKLLTKKTVLYLTTHDGTSKTTFGDICNAVKGGLDLDTVEITANEEFSHVLERKRQAIEYLNRHMRMMSCEQVESLVAFVHSQ